MQGADRTRRRRIRAGLTASVAMILATGLTVPGGAQDRAAGSEDAGGLTLTFGLSTSLRYDDNPNLDPNGSTGKLSLETPLNFGLLSQTRVQRLALGLSGLLRLSDASDGTQGLDRPRATLDYTREGARSRLGLSSSYTESRLGLLTLTEADPIIDPVTGEITLDTGTGRRATSSVALKFETGIDMPLGFTLNARHMERRYLGDASAANDDSRSDSLSGRLRLTFSPVLEGGLSVTTSHSETDDVDRTRQDSRAVAASLDYAYDPATRFGIELGRAEAVRKTLTTRDETVGTSIRLSAERELPRGSAGLSYVHEIAISGARDTLMVTRSLETPLSKLGFSLGAARGDSGNAALVGSVSYRQEFKRSRIDLALSRDLRSNNDGDQVIATRLSLDYGHDLTALSSFSLGLNLAQVEAEATADTSQAELQLTLARELTPDWTLSAGYEHRRSSSISGDATSNAVFLTIGRDFRVRP